MLTPFWNTFLWLKQLFNVKILISRLRSCSVPKITEDCVTRLKVAPNMADPISIKDRVSSLKGCGMGPWLVLVSPCFRENVVATCKIGSFLCSLDNLLQKNVIALFFGNQISKWRSFEKRAISDLLFTFFSHQGKLQKSLQHISHPHSYMYFAHPIDLFWLTNFEKIRIYQIRFLFGMSPGVDSYSRHFGTINK